MAEGSSTRSWRVIGVLLAAVALVLGVLGLVTVLPNLNPFQTEETDRSQPVLLQAVRDLSQYHAAVGEFQVVVDLEKDAKFLPDFLIGERALFVAAGTVNAYVDFAGLKGDALTVSQDQKSVEVRLPKPRLDKPNLDQKRSYLVAEERGIWNKFKSLFEVPDQQQLYVLGEQKIADAAQQAGLIERAEKNTQSMLTGMLQSLGFSVTFRSSQSD
jgi:Protein of unknown function (DUF4230)